MVLCFVCLKTNEKWGIVEILFRGSLGYIPPHEVFSLRCGPTWIANSESQYSIGYESSRSVCLSILKNREQIFVIIGFKNQSILEVWMLCRFACDDVGMALWCVHNCRSFCSFLYNVISKPFGFLNLEICVYMSSGINCWFHLSYIHPNGFVLGRHIYKQ